MKSHKEDSNRPLFPPYTLRERYWLFLKRDRIKAIVVAALPAVALIAGCFAFASWRNGTNQTAADQIAAHLSIAEEAFSEDRLADAQLELARADGRLDEPGDPFRSVDLHLGYSTPVREQRQRADRLRKRIQARTRLRSFLEEADSAEHNIIGGYWRLLPHEEVGRRKAIKNPSERDADLDAGLQAARRAADFYRLPEDLDSAQHLEKDGLSANDARTARRRAAELLFLWGLALERKNQGQLKQVHDAALRRSIGLLDAAESLGFKTKMLYQFRGGFHQNLGNQASAEADLKLADKTQPRTFFDHHLLAAEIRYDDQLATEIRHYHLALARRPGDRWTLFRLAKALERAGDKSQAVSMYQRLIAIEPRNATLRNNLGNLLMDLERFEESERELKAAIEIKADFYMAHNNLALLYVESKRFAEARVICNRLLAGSVPKDVASDAHDNLGLACERTGQRNDALEHYQQACQLDPHNAGAHRNGALMLIKFQRFEEAKRRVEHAIKTAPDYADLYVVQGEILAKEGRLLDARGDRQSAEKLYVRSVAAFGEAIKRGKPGKTMRDAYYNRGVIRRRLGKLDEAWKDQSEVLKLTRGYDRNAVYEMAMNYVAEKQWRAAAGLIDQILGRNPRDTEALLLRCQVLGDRGTDMDLVQAEADLDKYIEMTANEPAGYRTRGLTRFRRKNWQGAIDDWERYLELRKNAPDRSSIHADIGTALLNLRRFEESLKHYNLSIKMKPSLSVLAGRANAWLRTGNLKKAMADCNVIIDRKLDPAQSGVAKVLARTHGLRGEARMRNGEFAKAIEDFDRALRLHDLYTLETLAERAFANYCRGDNTAATADLQRVVQDAEKHAPQSIRLTFARGMRHFLEDRMPLAVVALARVPDDELLGLLAHVLRAKAWLKIGGRGRQFALNEADGLLKKWPAEELARSHARTIYEALANGSSDATLTAEASKRLKQLSE